MHEYKLKTLERMAKWAAYLEPDFFLLQHKDWLMVRKESGIHGYLLNWSGKVEIQQDALFGTCFRAMVARKKWLSLSSEIHLHEWVARVTINNYQLGSDYSTVCKPVADFGMAALEAVIKFHRLDYWQNADPPEKDTK
jgi:hypothetical protein